MDASGANLAATLVVGGIVVVLLSLFVKKLIPIAEVLRLWLASHHELQIVQLGKSLARTAVQWVRDSTEADQLLITGEEKLEMAVSRAIRLFEEHGLVDIDDEYVESMVREAYIDMIRNLNTLIDNVLMDPIPPPPHQTPVPTT